MSLEWVLWLLPPLFLLHDAEEILTWGWWMRHKHQHIFAFRREPDPSTFASRDTRQMTAAVLAVGVFVLAGTLQGIYALRTGGQLWLLGVLLSIWTGHSLIHVAASLFHRMYVPGLVTTLVLVLPHGIWAYQRLLDAGVLSPATAVMAAAAGLVGGPLLLRVAHGVGRLVFPTAGR